jgi:hypothetical protein
MFNVHPLVVVPFTRLHPITKQVLDGYGLDVRYVDVSASDDSYRLLLQKLWDEHETISIIEHDIVPYPGAIEEAWACCADWCTHSYSWTNERGESGVGVSHMLGCAKLSPRLMDAVPDVWRTPCHWTECDRRLFFAARDAGIDPHEHRPAVVHLKAAA